jgi:hypothetical protein
VNQTSSVRDDLLDEYGRADAAPLGTLAEFRVKLDAFANEVLREDAEQQKAVPRTERSIWQGIVDALNAALAANMAVGIDLDGTLTDHNAWSVVWDRDTKQWVLAGYDAEEAGR